jgi:hypothetical protein
VKPRLDVEANIRNMEKFCFSSQFYFLSFIGLSGICFIVIGVQIILETAHNPFTDIMVFLFLLINQLFIFISERFALWLRNRFKVWETKEKTVETQESPEVIESELLEKDLFKKLEV